MSGIDASRLLQTWHAIAFVSKLAAELDVGWAAMASFTGFETHSEKWRGMRCALGECVALI